MTARLPACVSFFMRQIKFLSNSLNRCCTARDGELLLANTDKQKAKGRAKHAERLCEACKAGGPSWRGEEFTGFMQGINYST